jgi:hypothetical protein
MAYNPLILSGMINLFPLGDILRRQSIALHDEFKAKPRGGIIVIALRVFRNTEGCATRGAFCRK